MGAEPVNSVLNVAPPLFTVLRHNLLLYWFYRDISVIKDRKYSFLNLYVLPASCQFPVEG